MVVRRARSKDKRIRKWMDSLDQGIKPQASMVGLAMGILTTVPFMGLRRQFSKHFLTQKPDITLL